MKYHRSIGFPKSLILPNGRFSLIYTDHADLKSERIFGLASVMHDLFDHVYIDKNSIIEATTDDNVYCKTVVIRYRVTMFDIILSLKLITGRTGLVLTVWDNNIGDN